MAFSGDVETVLTFPIGPIGQFEAWREVLGNDLLDLGCIALGAAQSEGEAFANPEQVSARLARGDLDPASVCFAGLSSLNLLAATVKFAQKTWEIGEGASGASLEAPNRRDFRVTREIPAEQRRALGEILGPARHEQGVQSITMSHTQPMDSFGNRSGVMAVGFGVGLTRTKGSEYRQSLNLRLSAPDGTNVAEVLDNPRMTALKISSEYIFNHGVGTSPYDNRPITFSDLGAWTAMLTQLS